ncbi:MAG: DUF1080 domain-containing protein [Tannerellaceae bacterium]|nr:DUF1080 domain-containing protein [Tannerellaceae bacterium]
MERVQEIQQKMTRRRFFSHAFLWGATAVSSLRLVGCSAPNAKTVRAIFDGKTLNGWKAIPRLYIPRDPKFVTIPPEELKAALFKFYEDRNDTERIKHIGKWEVVDGAISGKHDPEDSLFGAYLLTEEKFGDFELELDANPDWPIDTGIMVRAHEVGSVGFQVLIDYRPFGTVGGIYGNSIGNFRTTGFAFNGDKLLGYRVTNMQPSDPDGNFTSVEPTFTATFDDFVRVWKLNDWNRIKIRCVGRIPVITIWVNDFMFCELDTSKIEASGYDAEAVAKLLGPSGHIGFEVHDISPNSQLSHDRWAKGAACRWKNITIKEL